MVKSWRLMENKSKSFALLGRRLLLKLPVFIKDTEVPPCGVDDMTKLAYLHEPGVLNNLRSRYEINEIYDLLTKHGNVVAKILTAHYDEFFDQYENLLKSPNYITPRQSIKLLSDFLLESPNPQIMKRYSLHLRSSLFESHDDIVDGITPLNPASLCDIPVFPCD